MAEERLVLSDSSPLIALDSAGGFQLPRELFGILSITPQVREEVLAGGTRAGAAPLRKALAERWIRLHPSPKSIPQEFARLGAGEASTLAAGVESGGNPCLLLDDESARREAGKHGLEFTGTIGILVVAKRRKLIAEVKPYLARLADHGFHISPELGRSALKDAGEY